MRFLIGFGVCVCIANASACVRSTSPAGSSASSAQQTILQLEEIRRAAYERLDSTTLSGLLAEDYILIAPTGAMRDRQGALEALVRHSPDLPFDSITHQDVRVRLHGSAAVVTGLSGLFMQDIRTSPPEPVHRLDRYTNAWVQHRGEWKLLNTQITRIHD
jgi:hypothetical protein